ncbi:hypothetical protein B0T26DRAFT_753079 [Lasiosphaeria miniovina]|uniref:Oxidoreductase n=1 Tax=Lasiosphaeria miniovina TaxID=1954250 RepID=A0AA40ABL8_9PEZI|nr:uncharacterized protein B0T26DRAFT_753079 [Lasiosphaeria miniovina]KAK0712902.1 hypothetical protein B0T26DRAFT_753079 [Lasiosphaeria miniovina]
MPHAESATTKPAPQGDSDKTIPSLAGQVILITGGTGGLGAASAVQLARGGPARIYVSGRRESAAATVIDTMRAALPTSSTSTTDVRFLRCDLADLASVCAAADEVLARDARLDVLLANAGVAAVPPARTSDGYEVHFGTNHVGHALLVRKLLPLLQAASGRVVFVTSFGYRGAWGIPFASIKPQEGAAATEGKQQQQQKSQEWTVPVVSRWTRYAESKLANILYARELAERYPEVASVSVTPGFVATGMTEGMGLWDRAMVRAGSHLFSGRRGIVSAEDGARNQVWAATVDRGALATGGLYDPVGVLAAEKSLMGPARDRELGRRLWDWTEGELKGWL